MVLRPATPRRHPRQNARRSFRSLSPPMIAASSIRSSALDLSLLVLDQRADAAREAQDAWSAFALDLLGAEAKRGNAAIDRQAVAARGAIERRGHAEDLAPPFPE